MSYLFLQDESKSALEKVSKILDAVPAPELDTRADRTTPSEVISTLPNINTYDKGKFINYIHVLVKICFLMIFK